MCYPAPIEVSGCVTQITHNVDSTQSNDINYNIIYNTLGMKTDTSVGPPQNAQTLTTTTYQHVTINGTTYVTGRVDSVKYYTDGNNGTGKTLDYGYDTYDRLTSISEEGITPPLLYSFAYDNRGNIAYIDDNVQNVKYYIDYDVMERAAKVTRVDGITGNWSTSSYTYNARNELTDFSEANAYYQDSSQQYQTCETSYTYDNDGRTTAVNIASDTASENIAYDTFKRATGYSYKIGTNDIYDVGISYFPGSTGTKTQRPQTVTYTNFVDGSKTLTYTYDYRGYILSVTKDSNNYSQYKYDDLGELIRENYKWDGSTPFTMIYTYDQGGNILTKKKYAEVDMPNDPSGDCTEVDYSYGDSNWKDRLTSYNGTTLSYDSIGNLTNDGMWTYTWDQGKELKQAQETGKTASYLYNNDGIRTQKIVNGVKTIYNVVGGKITWEKTDDQPMLYYYYDPSGKLVGLEYNDGNASDPYFYIYDVQGDIIKIVNWVGTVEVTYTYDAWGNCTVSGPMAWTLGYDNPFRYRGYYYDNETGLYYLNNRYYNPQWGRFISADSDSGNTGLLTHNLFAYCQNNPIMHSDHSGHGGWEDILQEVLDWIGETPAGEWIDNIGDSVNEWIEYQAIPAIGSGLSSAWNWVCNLFSNPEVDSQLPNDVEEVPQIYNASTEVYSDFQSEAFLERHFSEHGAEMGYTNAQDYLQGARNLLNSQVGGDIEGFTSPDGWVFRFNKVTQQFACGSNQGTISSYFIPNDPWNYWLEQIYKYDR